MMIKFKILETINNGRPEIGDYVICHSKQIGKIFYNFFATHIGVIINTPTYNYGEEEKELYQNALNNNVYIKYEGLKDSNFLGSTVKFGIKNIKYWSKNKEDLQKIIDSEKFGL